MVVGLSDRVANAISVQVNAVLRNDALAGQCVKCLHPFVERRSKVKTDMLIISQLCVGPVALRMDTFVPVEERGRSGFHRDDSRYRIFAWRLVEMGVNTK